MNTTWYSTLSLEEQFRLAPSYVNLLLEQLATAHRRQEKLIKVADRYNAMKLANRKGLCCKNCFEIENVRLVLRCRGCFVWGCRRCNTKEKRVVKCGGCGYTTCERCDPSIKDYDPNPEIWRCFVCDIAVAIVKECNDRMELLRSGKITRGAAVVIWTDDTENKESLGPVYDVLKSRLGGEWNIFMGNKSELAEDFPEIESCALVITPDFDQSPISMELAKELNQLFFPDDDPDSWKFILENMVDSSFRTARITYTAGEWIDDSIEAETITEEQAQLATQELRDSIFD